MPSIAQTSHPVYPLGPTQLPSLQPPTAFPDPKITLGLLRSLRVQGIHKRPFSTLFAAISRPVSQAALRFLPQLVPSLPGVVSSQRTHKVFPRPFRNQPGTTEATTSENSPLSNTTTLSYPPVALDQTQLPLIDFLPQPSCFIVHYLCLSSLYLYSQLRG